MKCVLTTPEIEIQPRESSSTIIAYVVRSRPIPPYSSGIVTPNRPSSFICSTTSSGNESSWSCFSATGMICSSTNWWTISVMAFCSSVFSVYGEVATAMFSAAPETLTRGSISAAGGYPPGTRPTPVSAVQRAVDELGAGRAQRGERHLAERPHATHPHVRRLAETGLGDGLAGRGVVGGDLGQHRLVAALGHRVGDRRPGPGSHAAPAEVGRGAGVLQADRVVWQLEPAAARGHRRGALAEDRAGERRLPLLADHVDVGGAADPCPYLLHPGLVGQFGDGLGFRVARHVQLEPVGQRAPRAVADKVERVPDVLLLQEDRVGAARGDPPGDVGRALLAEGRTQFRQRAGHALRKVAVKVP